MSYRHHQPYYGSQYFPDNFPTYHGDFYGQHLYHDYYGTTPYYNPQHWQGFMPPGKKNSFILMFIKSSCVIKKQHSA